MDFYKTCFGCLSNRNTSFPRLALDLAAKLLPASHASASDRLLGYSATDHPWHVGLEAKPVATDEGQFIPGTKKCWHAGWTIHECYGLRLSHEASKIQTPHLGATSDRPASPKTVDRRALRQNRRSRAIGRWDDGTAPGMKDDRTCASQRRGTGRGGSFFHRVLTILAS